MNIKSRICTKCKNEKSLTEFYKHSKAKYGRFPECKICYLERCREYRNRPENKEVIKVKKKNDYYERKRSNHKEILRKGREYRAKNPDIKRENNRRYRERNPDMNIKHKNLRRARLAGVESGALPSKNELLQKQNGMCANCKVKGINVNWHLDHIVPLKHGGNHTKDNIQILCASCNLKKQAKMPEQWAHENGRLL